MYCGLDRHTLSSACAAAIHGSLSVDAYRSRALTPWARFPPTSHLHSHASWLMVASCSSKLWCPYTHATRNTARANSGGKDFFICSSALDLAKTHQIWKALQTETDLSIKQSYLCYTFRAVLMKFTTISIIIKEEAVLNLAVKTEKVNLDWTDKPKYAQRQLWFLEPRQSGPSEFNSP